MAVIRPFLIGFATTLKHLFKKPITVNYPEQKFPMFPKYRGKQVLMRDENGLEKCVACGLCSVACPADAIYLEAAENDGTVQAGPRYASVYQIHKTRCIFCGYCEEACPVGAIFMGKDYELAVYSKDDFVWDKTGPAGAGGDVAGADAGAGRRGRQGWTGGTARPSTPVLPSSPPAHADRRARRHPRRVRHRRRHHEAARRTCRSGCRSATSRATTASISRRSRRSTGSRATTRTSTSSRAAIGGRAAGADAALPAERRPASGRSVARRGARRHVRAELVSHAGGGAAAVARAQDGRRRR